MPSFPNIYHLLCSDGAHFGLKSLQVFLSDMLFEAENSFVASSSLFLHRIITCLVLGESMKCHPNSLS